MNVDKVVLIGNVVYHRLLEIAMHLEMIGSDKSVVDQTFTRSN